MPLQHQWHEFFAKAEPCHFPPLVSGHGGLLVDKECFSTIHVPRYGNSGHAVVSPLDRTDEIILAFTLLLKAYTGSDVLSYGVLDNSRSTTAGDPKSATNLVSATLDPSATLLSNSGRLTRYIPGTRPDHEIQQYFDLREQQTGFKHFNTSLVVMRSGPHGDAFANVFSSSMILFAEAEGEISGGEEKKGVSLRFSGQLLDDWTAHNVLATFERILHSVVNESDNLLRNISLISSRDQRLIAKWNAELPPPAGETLNERLEKVFHTHENEEAVFTTAGNFTYGQLDDLSSLLAERLVRLGLSRNMIVPVCMNKSRWATCAMVAIWKAGSAVTTMDPSYPDERLFAMMDDMGSKIIISDEAHAVRFKIPSLHVVADLEQLPDLLNAQSTCMSRRDSWRMANVKPEDLAQVAWTSGSSGKPKGVLHSHDRLTSEHRSYIWNMEYNGGQRVLQFGSYAFVAGVNDAFHTMLHGATLCVPSEMERTSGLVGFMSRARVSRAYLTPSVLRTLNPSELPTLKHLCVGGETIDRELEELWASHLHFISLYGGRSTCEPC